jgi:hypothetical protein
MYKQITVLVIGTLALLGAGSSRSLGDSSAMFHMPPGSLAKAPLRNDVKVVLDAPVGEVWAIISDHGQLPSYSAGIREVVLDDSCQGPGGGVGCTRTCSFHEGPPIAETIVFVEEPYALATRGVQPNEYQLTNDLTLVTLRPLGDDRTEFWWRQYYDHPQLEQMKPVFDEALRDLGQRLVQRFGAAVQQ